MVTQVAPVKQGNGLGVAALVVGIVAAVFSVIPLVGMVAFFLGPVAIILAIIGLTRKMRPKGTSVAGLILGIASIVIAAVMTAGTVAAIDAVDKEINKEVTITYKATSENEASSMFGGIDGTSNEKFTGTWTKEVKAKGFDAASLVVSNEDFSSSQKVTCEILIDGKSVSKQSGEDMVNCSGSTIAP